MSSVLGGHGGHSPSVDDDRHLAEVISGVLLLVNIIVLLTILLMYPLCFIAATKLCDFGCRLAFREAARGAAGGAHHGPPVPCMCAASPVIIAVSLIAPALLGPYTIFRIGAHMLESVPVVRAAPLCGGEMTGMRAFAFMVAGWGVPCWAPAWILLAGAAVVAPTGRMAESDFFSCGNLCGLLCCTPCWVEAAIGMRETSGLGHHFVGIPMGIEMPAANNRGLSAQQAPGHLGAAGQQEPVGYVEPSAPHPAVVLHDEEHPGAAGQQDGGRALATPMVSGELYHDVSGM